MVTPRKRPPFRFHDTMADVHVAIKQKTDPNRPSTTSNPHPADQIQAQKQQSRLHSLSAHTRPIDTIPDWACPLALPLLLTRLGAQQQHHQRLDTIHSINHLHLDGSTQDMESPPPSIDRNPTHRLGDHPCSYNIQLPSVRYHMAPPVHDTRQRQTGSVSTSATTPTRPDQRSPETYRAKGTQQERQRDRTKVQ